MLDATRNPLHVSVMFKRWYKKSKFENQSDCARFLGLHRSTISRMLNSDDYVPDKATALYIELKTNGAVSASSWERVKP